MTPTPDLFTDWPEPPSVADSDTSVADPRTLARRTDPETSRQAADEIAGAVAALQWWAVVCVRMSPGKTQRELGAIYCPDDLRKIGRRLGEAAKKGLLRRGPVRKCSITGRNAETWYPPAESTP